MVKSMFAGVTGLKSHQQKLDVIGNNIANVNTWGFKSSTFNFADSMYTSTISGTGGTNTAGGTGGVNPSQVGYGVELSSISTQFATGAPSPSSSNMDCMIDGTGFFLVGSMVNGTFDDVESSGLSLSRVGIFSVDSNGYLVDDQGNYVYGYAVIEGTGIPESNAVKESVSITKADVTVTANDDNTFTINIAGVDVTTKAKELTDQIQEWIAEVTGTDGAFQDYTIALDNYQEGAINGNVQEATVNMTFLAKRSGTVGTQADGTEPTSGIELDIYNYLSTNAMSENTVVSQLAEGADRVARVDAEYETTLSTIRIPTDTATGTRKQLATYNIAADGTISGIDDTGKEIVMGQIVLVSVENPNGLEKTDSYYYTFSDNCGLIEVTKAASGPVGSILSGYLEMANVDLANEFTQMITTQRGYQANSKIITVTDEMLQELINMKR